MTCNQIRELMPDLAAGLNAVTPEMKSHLHTCSECSGKLEAFRQTMTLLDEWRVPEASPYFDVRLHARLLRQALARASREHRPHILEVASGRADVLQAALLRIRG